MDMGNLHEGEARSARNGWARPRAAAPASAGRVGAARRGPTSATDAPPANTPQDNQKLTECLHLPTLQTAVCDGRLQAPGRAAASARQIASWGRLDRSVDAAQRGRSSTRERTFAVALRLRASIIARREAPRFPESADRYLHSTGQVVWVMLTNSGPARYEANATSCPVDGRSDACPISHSMRPILFDSFRIPRSHCIVIYCREKR
jgi:hypothetical protein